MSIADDIRKRKYKNGHQSRNGVHGPLPAWEPPLQLGEVPSVEPFPLQVFPAALQDFAIEGAKALNCPADYFAVPMLAIAGGSIGNSNWLNITHTHQQSAALFACVVGSKGTAKSPALKFVRNPLDKNQRQFFEAWRREMIGFNELEKEERGQPPILRRCIVGDTTTESLSIVLDENPRGLVLVRDELAGMLASLNQYKGGGGHDRQWFLELWSHTLSPRDRKSDKRPPVFLDRPMVGIIGGTQPDVVERFRGESHRGVPPPDDGFLDRWLFCYPDELPAKGETWMEISPDAMEAWSDCIFKLLALTGVREDGGEDRPFFIRLDSSGRQTWEQFTNELAAEMNKPDFPDYLRGFWAKLRGYAGRLALIVHVLRQVCGENIGNELDGESMARAVLLVGYFQSHARKTYAVMGADSRVKSAQRILTWIVREKRTEFKAWEIHKDIQSEGMFPSLESLGKPLELLVNHRFIRERDQDTEAPRRGRPPASVFEVNPLWDRRENRVNRGKGPTDGNIPDLHDLPDRSKDKETS